MAGLPKKFAKMGFKKGWRLFKASKSKSKTRTPNKKARSIKVARRRTRAKKRVTRRKSNTWGMLKPVMEGAGQFIYGASRGTIQKYVQPQAQRVLGNFGGRYADNVAMAGAALAASMLIKKPLVRKVAKEVIRGELFLAGLETGANLGSMTARAAPQPTQTNSFR